MAAAERVGSEVVAVLHTAEEENCIVVVVVAAEVLAS